MRFHGCQNLPSCFHCQGLAELQDQQWIQHGYPPNLAWNPQTATSSVAKSSCRHQSLSLPPAFFLRRLVCSCPVCSHRRCLHWGRNVRCPSGRVPLERQAAQPPQENHRQHPAGKHRGNIQRRGAHKEETRQQKDGKKHQEHDLTGQWLYALRGFVWWVLNLSMTPSGPMSYRYM